MHCRVRAYDRDLSRAKGIMASGTRKTAPTGRIHGRTNQQLQRAQINPCQRRAVHTRPNDDNADFSEKGSFWRNVLVRHRDQIQIHSGRLSTWRQAPFLKLVSVVACRATLSRSSAARAGPSAFCLAWDVLAEMLPADETRRPYQLLAGL